ncbi:class I SAM-dependent methyltransferase [Niabella sp.]|uniref:class I SAM-dependent methyltransferase n=1 Tax=Niabella sp. TaxID=1962976 RepID=UPI00261FF3BA|nr:class I SAM-dependent methyltransferase [Niabella sp.]
MKQNIYDDATFFEGYYALRKTEAGLNKVLEVPAFRSMLSKLNGKVVLDLGCGFGDNCMYAVKQGAKKVIGMDISGSMLTVARERYVHPDITFIRCPMEDWQPVAGGFDWVISSLAIHYVQDYAGLVQKINRSLVSGGRLLFSVEHPVCTAREAQQWVLDAKGQELYWPVDHYQQEGARNTTWFVKNVLKYHRTMETYINVLIDNGFKITRLLEPEPLPAFVKEKPALALHSRRPPFLLLAAQKIS